MLIHNTTTERGVSLVNCCNKSKASLVSKDKCMRVQWEGDQKRSREHPEDAASGGTAPAGPGPQDGWMEGLCWQGGKTKGRRRRRGSHTFSREAESIVQKLIKPKHLQQPSNSRMCPCVCVCVCVLVWGGCSCFSGARSACVRELGGEAGNVCGWWMGALREASFNHCSLVKYTTVLPNCSAIMSERDEWLQPALTYSLHQCRRKLHLIILLKGQRRRRHTVHVLQQPSLSFYAKL